MKLIQELNEQARRGAESALMSKMKEMQIKDFSDEELKRVFKDTNNPEVNIRAVRYMVKRGLTTKEVYS